MFDLENWQEVLHSIRQNKLRTFLTGFSVAWGIFMLIVLLGSGNGLKNAAQHNFASDASNTLSLFDGRTSKPYKGLGKGRDIQFNNEDYQLLKERFPQIDKISSRYSVYGTNNIFYKDEYGDYSVRGVHPEMAAIENTWAEKGRLINRYDVQKKRKVAVIGQKVYKELFDSACTVGEYIRINNVTFRIAGVYGDQSERDQDRIYIPVSTGQEIFGDGRRVDALRMMLGDMTAGENKKFEDAIVSVLARKHQFDKTDKSAIYIWNHYENYLQFMQLFAGINLFIWIIGFGTIIAGIVGVSNIMIIVVKDRTKEIGIRKAIGARPKSIIGMILFEAVLITTVAGYFGLVGGVGIMELVDNIMPASQFFRNPEVNFGIAVSATILLVASGLVAGFFPARRAAKIKPIVALRNE